MKEYIWIPETQIAPTSFGAGGRLPGGESPAPSMGGSRTVVDRPLAVVNAVNTASPVMWWVSVDHLHRPIKMTDAAKLAVWTAVWTPWGTPQSLTGTATLDARFPGQWYQMEAGLHYNWNRSYDPSLGRYTQPDPLGFVDGPSVYGYAGGNPVGFTDRFGLMRAELPSSTQHLLPGQEQCVAGGGPPTIEPPPLYTPVAMCGGDAIHGGLDDLLDGDSPAPGCSGGGGAGGAGGGSPASAPTGRSGAPLANAPIQPSRNPPSTIGNRPFTGHALDQMQNRGVTPSVVNNAINNGAASPGRDGTVIYFDKVNNISVVVNPGTGNVITVRGGPP